MKKRISPRPSKKIRFYYSALRAIGCDPLSLKEIALCLLASFIFSFLFFVYLFCFY